MTSPSNQQLNDNETNFRILSFGPPPPVTVRDVLDADEQEKEGRAMVPPNEEPNLQHTKPSTKKPSHSSWTRVPVRVFYVPS